MYILSATDSDPVITASQRIPSELVFCCDHAGAQIPESLGTLGLSQDDLQSHIALDVGVFSTTSWLAGQLKAPLVAQPYSRLVIDCNRLPGTLNSIPDHSDGRKVPGNIGLSQSERNRREAEILIPYQNKLAQVLKTSTEALGFPPILVAMHSFSRQLGGKKRNLDLGIIYDGYTAFGDRLLNVLKNHPEIRVGHNLPYKVDFDDDYTLPIHTKGGVLPYVEIEICQDLISTCKGQRRLAEILLPAFRRVLGEMKQNDD